MNNRSWLWLLSIALAFAPQTGKAQTLPLSASPNSPPKRSHFDLPGGPDMENAQEMMADRLKELHELHQLQDQVQGLLKDPEFVDRLKKIPPQELEHLREKILSRKGLGQDENWKKLLDQAGSANKLNAQQIDLLRRWAERSDQRVPMQTPFGPSPGALPSSPDSPRPANSLPPGSGGTFSPPAPKESSWWDKLQAKSTDWIKDHMDDLGGDLADAITNFAGTDEGAPLADLLRTLKSDDFSGAGFAEPAADLADHLPELGKFLHKPHGVWSEMGSIFRHAREASLPTIGGGPDLPSLPATPSVSGEDWGGGALALLAVGIVLLLFWNRGGWSRWQTHRSEASEWQLGPWPVQPGAISTRRDLVRAFEHLALLCLGWDASTCHHRELADRLADGNGTEDGRRRQAADLLAWLYEQARYAPEDEALSPEELTEARHALCFLAGVPVA